jgi:hypothetical protein
MLQTDKPLILPKEGSGYAQPRPQRYEQRPDNGGYDSRRPRHEGNYFQQEGEQQRAERPQESRDSGFDRPYRKGGQDGHGGRSGGSGKWASKRPWKKSH